MSKENSSTEAMVTTDKTPIEITLGVDDDGMTTARKLYAFLELDEKNFSRWCRKHIINNPYAEEKVDFWPFVMNEEWGGRASNDYKLTAHFAKRLSMTGNTEKHEQAREYFIACEQGLKVATQKIAKERERMITELSMRIDSMSDCIDSLIGRIDALEEKLNTPQNTEQVLPQPTTYKKPYNPWFARMVPKYKLLEEYFGVTRGELYRNILWELENLYDVDTRQMQIDYCYEHNISSCYPLEPYEFIPKYRKMIEGIVNSNLIKYGIASEDDPITTDKHITIFDQQLKVVAS